MLVAIVIFVCFTVENASHTFYNAQTYLTEHCDGNMKQKRRSEHLNKTTHPEEKRKIIGDTFMTVCFIPFY